jgi:CheY-specific phosphatase CheX
MLPQQKTATLTTIFSEVLANLAFMFTDEEPAVISPGEVWIETTIGYRGTAAGTLTLLCTRDFARLLAANLLGIDPEDETADSRAHDAAKEFINIVCGQLVTTLHGTQHAFDISIPVSRELPTCPEPSGEEGSETCVLSVEGHRVLLAYLPGQTVRRPG